MQIEIALFALTIHIQRCRDGAVQFLRYAMQAAKLDRTGLPPADSKPGPAVSGPSAIQAAAYIQDMATALRSLAQRHHMGTLSLLLEMAAVEAATIQKSDAPKV
jgi:hypothetical protein